MFLQPGRICCVLALSSALALRADDGAKKQEELKWARGVADDFFRALRAHEPKDAAALLTADYRKLLDQTPRWRRP
jgi:hypothetical protein